MLLPGPVAVIQPLPGIGDMLWHVPHIRAIAAQSGQAVTLVAKPRSAAAELLGEDSAINDVMWLDRNPGRRRGEHDGPSGFLGLAGMLRRRGFGSIVLLHHSRTLALACRVAGIPNRFGYGAGTQRWFLNRAPYLDRRQLALDPAAQASAWLQAASIPLADREPVLPIAAERQEMARQQLGIGDLPLAVIGVGTSEPYKQWGEDRYVALAEALLRLGWQSLAVVGGSAEAALVAAIERRLTAHGGVIHTVVGWNLGELAALLATAIFYIGNDTGVMNLAAAVGVRAYGLFGATPPLDHSRNIVPVTPPDGRIDKATGMARITVEMVVEVIRSDRGLLEPA